MKDETTLGCWSGDLDCLASRRSGFDSRAVHLGFLLSTDNCQLSTFLKEGSRIRLAGPLC
jgi:hypothetical protein